MTKMMILYAGTALLAIGACNKAPDTTATQQSSQPPISETTAPVTVDVAVVAAATCAGWPKQVLDNMGKLNFKQPDVEPAPYFNFPDGKTITVSADGKCTDTVPTRVISATPMRHLGQHVIAVQGEYDSGHVWLLIMQKEEDNKRTFWVMDGVPSKSMPFDAPSIGNSS